MSGCSAKVTRLRFPGDIRSIYRRGRRLKYHQNLRKAIVLKAMENQPNLVIARDPISYPVCTAHA